MKTPDHPQYQRLPLLFSAYLPVLVAILFSLGIWSASLFRLLLSHAFAAILFLALLLFFTAVHLVRKKQTLWVIALTGAIFYLLGLGHALHYLTSPANPDHIATVISSPRRVLVQGIVTRTPSRRDYGTILHLETTGVAVILSDPSPLPPAISPAYGKVRLMVYGPAVDWIEPGSHILAKARLRPPQPQRNPGGFHFKNHLHTQHIFTTGSVSSFALVQKVTPLPRISWFRKTTFFLETLRFQAGHKLDSMLQNRSIAVRGIYKAILTGERGEIPEAILEAFRGAGAMHLLAISGLHMGVLSVFFFCICRVLFSLSSRFLLAFSLDRWSAFCALLPLTVYAFVAGLQPPVVRALIMTMFFLWAVMVRRRHTLINLIGAAALVILLQNPLLLFTASFQLSFIAVTAIALVLQQGAFVQRHPAGSRPRNTSPLSLLWSETSRKIQSWLIGSIMISVAATLATAPLLFFHFNRVSLLSPVATLVMEPVLCLWTLLAGLVGLTLSPVFPDAATTLLQAGSVGIELLLPTARFFAALPGASLWWPTPSALSIIVLYLIVLVVFLEPGGFSLPQKIIATTLATLLLFPGIRLAERILSTTTTVTFLDVKHGSSAVLHLPGNRTFLVDGGSMGQNSRPGRRIIAPALWSKGIFRLDGIVVTHGDSDHVNGLEFVTQRFLPTHVWTRDDTNQGREMSRLLSICRRLRIPVTYPAKKAVLYEPVTSDPGRRRKKKIRFEVLAGAEKRGNATMTSNDLSIVVRLLHGEKSFLFPGDIEKKGEEYLIDANRDLASSVLLSPHHGSNSSNSLIFLQKVSPEWLVISAPGDTAGFPHAAVLQRARSLGVSMAVTGEAGAITCVTDGRRLEIFPYTSVKSMDGVF